METLYFTHDFGRADVVGDINELISMGKDPKEIVGDVVDLFAKISPKMIWDHKIYCWASFDDDFAVSLFKSHAHIWAKFPKNLREHCWKLASPGTVYTNLLFHYDPNPLLFIDLDDEMVTEFDERYPEFTSEQKEIVRERFRKDYLKRHYLALQSIDAETVSIEIRRFMHTLNTLGLYVDTDLSKWIRKTRYAESLHSIYTKCQ